MMRPTLGPDGGFPSLRKSWCRATGTCKGTISDSLAACKSQIGRDALLGGVCERNTWDALTDRKPFS